MPKSIISSTIVKKTGPKMTAAMTSIKQGIYPSVVVQNSQPKVVQQPQLPNASKQSQKP